MDRASSPAGSQDRGEWDAIVIGTGMGGATLGHALAQAGWRVLFLEKGRSHIGNREALRGNYAEQFFPQPEAPQRKHREILARAGRCADELVDLTRSRPRRFIPFIGSGAGGSSALYGMAMERFSPPNFTPRGNFPAAPATSLPERWPVTYAELRLFYEAAERLYQVRGERDPLFDFTGCGQGPSAASDLLPPPPLQPGNQELFDFLRSRGLHPYRLPMACEYAHGNDRSQGFLDATGAKNDSAKICLTPALEALGACMLEECEVLRLEATRKQVTAIECLWRGERRTLRAPVVVLASGALATPGILLGSASPLWPNGLANDSGLVGRNLMRHFLDLYAVYPKTPGPYPGNLKQLAFNDFFHADGQRLGTLQSFGPLPAPGQIAAALEQELLEVGRPWAARFFRWARPALRPFLTRLSTRTLVLASMLEDLPYPQNRVTLAAAPSSPSGRRLEIRYQISAHEQTRIRAFREHIGAALRPYRFTRVELAESNTHLAHVCGTCRFGLDPAASVLDATNRAHGLENLYVVDASFFPSSGGANPGLTIAANALRVAAHLTERYARPHRTHGARHTAPASVVQGRGPGELEATTRSERNVYRH